MMVTNFWYPQREEEKESQQARMKSDADHSKVIFKTYYDINHCRAHDLIFMLLILKLQ